MVYAKCKPLLVIHALQGLTDRMRAVASACSVAKATGRHLHIIWEAQDGVAAPFGVLFEVPDPKHFTVADTPPFLSYGDYVFYDGSSDGTVAQVPTDHRQHLYVRLLYHSCPVLLVPWFFPNTADLSPQR